jgi:DNA-binding MarR family transcriptional regulator
MSASGERVEADACGILANLWQLIQSVMDDAAPALERLGLAPKAFFLLAAVVDVPFPAELARRMHLPPPTVTYLIKQLESKGFLERRPERGDLRKFRLIVTPEGMEAIGRCEEALGAVLDERLLRLNQTEIATFDKLVTRLATREAGGA